MTEASKNPQDNRRTHDTDCPQDLPESGPTIGELADSLPANEWVKVPNYNLVARRWT